MSGGPVVNTHSHLLVHYTVSLSCVDRIAQRDKQLPFCVPTGTYVIVKWVKYHPPLHPPTHLLLEWDLEIVRVSMQPFEPPTLHLLHPKGQRT